jgi:hypothetical protein
MIRAWRHPGGNNAGQTLFDLATDYTDVANPSHRDKNVSTTVRRWL